MATEKAIGVLTRALEEAKATLQFLTKFEQPLIEAGDLITSCLANGHKLLGCGNGGSAADVADFTTEFACRFQHDRQPYSALNLALGGSLLTAIGNDYGFDEIFARQVRAFGRAGDVLIAVSTSGKSKNIVRALEAARAMKLRSIALLGRDGGDSAGMAEIELIVPGNSAARLQEAHKFLLHVLCEMVEPHLAAH